MRKIYLLLLAVCVAGGVNGQSTANYTVISNTNGSLALDMNGNAIDMTTGTTSLVVASADDTQSGLTNFNLGSGSTFEFFLMGQRFTQFNASDNGVIGLGVSVGTAVYAIPNSTATIATIAPFANDMRVGTNGAVRAKVVGTAPSRCLVVEWSNNMIRFLSTAAAGTATFQARFYESTGIVEYVYGAMTTNTATPSSYYVGFSVNNTANNIVSLNTNTNAVNTTSTPTTNSYTASSTITDLNSAANGSRKYYRFIPPGNAGHASITSLAAPTGLSGNFTNITPFGMTLNWTASSPTTGILKYAIYNSTDGGTTYNFVNTTNIGTNTLAVSGLTSATTYTWKVIAISEGGSSSSLVATQATSSCPSGAQIYTIDNTLAASSTNFTSFTSAFNFFNSLISAGCTLSGDFTINVTAGQTFTEDPPVLTATGNGSFRLIFQKTVGANPVIKPTGTAGTSDAGIIISGGDNITFDGIDITINSGSAVEYGYLIRNASATNGAQNNIIKNTTITLNRTNTSSVGILQTSAATGGGVAATSSGGANSTNKYYNLTIKNVSAGIYLLGTSGFPDLTCEVGTTACGTFNTIGDPLTSTDIGNNSGQIWGIRATNQSGVKIYYNEVQNVSNTSIGQTDGIFVESSQGTCEVYNNKVHDIKTSSTSTSAAVVGLRLSHATAGTTVLRAYNNFIYSLTTGNPASASATRTLRGIYVSGTGGSTTNSYEIYHNSVRLDNTVGANGSNAVYEIASTTPVFIVKNNIFSNFTNSQSGVARHYGVRSTSASSLGGVGTLFQNNDIYIANQVNANGFTALGNATDMNGVSAFQTAFSTATANLELDPSFTSSTNLHSSATGLNNAGAASPPAYITNDIDCETRPQPAATNYDIGADEFTVNNDDAGVTAIILPSPLCPGSNSVQATIKNFGAATLNSVTVNWTVTPGGAQTPATPSISLASGASTTVTLGNFTFAAGTTYSITATTTLPNGNSDGNTANDAFTQNSITTGLTGTYTVGSGGDYGTLTAAIAAYNSKSLCGPVVFSLIDNTYGSETFPLTIGVNATANSTNTLTIKPAATKTPTISGSNNSAGLIILNGADYVTIDGSNSGGTDRSLTITNTSTTSPTAISMISLGTGLGATNNTIKNCNISTGISAATGYGISVGGSTPGTSGADNDNVTIQNNNVTIATVSIYANGTASTTSGGDDNLVITGNDINSNTTIQNQGIQVGNALTSSISQNNISVQTSGAVQPVGISLETGFVSSTVTRNKITNVLATNVGGYGGRGITVGTGTATSSLTIANNVIYGVNGSNWSAFDNSSSMGIGIGVLGGSTTLTTVAGGVSLYFNSINMSGSMGVGSTTAITSALYVGTGASALNIRDNVFVNTQTGTNASQKNYAIYSLAANTAFTTINNNDYFVSNSFNAASAIPGFIGSDRTNLAGIQTGFGSNTNSITGNPAFQNNTDLRPGVGSPVIAAGENPNITGISSDFLNASRATPPSMGAYESAVDVTGPTITYTPLSNGCSPSTNQTLTATITDASGVPTSGTGLPMLYYKVNAGSYTGVQGVSIGTNQYTFTFGAAATSAGDVISYYVVAQDNLNNISALPAAGASGLTANPPAAATPPTTPSSFTVTGSLSGSYNVGAGQTYTTITAAIADYNLKCLTGPVTFLLTDASYSEAGAMTINANANANSTNTLTIKPTLANTTVTVTGGSSTAIFILNGADYVTIDGSISSTANTVCPTVTASRDLTISNSSTSATAAGIMLSSASVSNGATNNVIRNCILTGNSSTTTGYGIAMGGTTVGSLALTANSSNTIQNNKISKFQIGINLLGTSTTTLDASNIVSLNNLGSSTVGDGFSIFGLQMEFQNGIQILRNDIQNIVGSGSTNLSGLALLDHKNSVIDQNKVHFMNYTGSSTTKIYAINSVNANFNTVGSQALNSFTNNMVYNITSSATSSVWNVSGMNANGGYNDKFYNNTVYLANQLSAASGTGASAAFSNGNGSVSTVSTNVDVRNNIFHMNGTSGAASTLYSHYTLNTSNAGLTLNNNDLVSVAGGSATAKIGRFNSTDYATLALWKGATNEGTASINQVPVYLSDPHIDNTNAANALLNGGAAVIGSVTTDIDCDARDGSAPDIGADEFTPPVCTTAVGGSASGSISYCVSGTPTITASGYSTGTGSTYQWISSTVLADFPNAGTPIGGQTSPASLTLGAAVTQTTYYWLRVTCATNTSTDNSTMVTVTINTPPTITITPTGTVNVCAPTTTQLLQVNTTNASTPSYQWKLNGSNIGGATSSSYTASATGSYTLTITDGGTTCSNTSAATVVNFNPQPGAVTITPSSATICSSGPGVLLTASGGTTGGSGNATLGTGITTTGATSQPTAFCNRWAQYWNQTIYTAAELTAAGLTAGSQITSITYTTTSQGDAANNTNFSIRFVNTASTTLSSFQTSGTFTTVFGPTSYTHAIGANLITFTTPFTWDGTSSIILDVRQDGVDATNNAITNFTAAADNKNIEAHTSTTSSTTALQTLVSNATVTPTASTTRLNVIFGYTSVQSPTWSWGPSAGLSGTSGASVTALPSITTQYTATATINGCTNAADVTVTVNTAATANANVDQTVCANSPNVTLNGIIGGGASSGTWSGGAGTFTPDASTLNATYTPTAGEITNGSVTLTLTTDDPAGPCGSASDQMVITFTPSSTPTVSIAASPSGAICAGTSVQFTATASSIAGGTVNYDFKVNGTSQQSSSSNTYTTTTLANGDQVTCDITVSGGTCLTSTTASSNTIPMTVNASSTPTVSIVASPSGTICAGTSVQFTATASNVAGGSVNYDFKVGGVSQQSSSSNTYTTSSLANGDQVTCDITVSGGTCLTSTTATSNTLTMSVTPNSTPSVNILASPTGPICAGTSVQFTAFASQLAGGTANYDFQIGGSSVQSSSSNTFTTSSLANGDQVTCVITVSGGTCLTTNTATSNTITMSVTPTSTPSVNILASPTGPICAGTSVQFTAFASQLGGGTANYDFQIGGSSVQSSSSNTFTTSSLANGDQVTCVITVSGGTCLTTNTATSNTITMTVNANNTPTVGIVASPSGAICAGTSVQFTATASNVGGGSVNYDFKVNGSSQQSSSSNTYITSSLANGDQVTCDITVSGGTCMAATTATSTTITMTVNANNTPTVSIAASPLGPICAGTSVQFTATASSVGGGTVNYNFKVGGVSQQSSSSNTYTTSGLSNGNQVTCDITVSGGNCMAATTATSNTITMTVNTNNTPTVSIAASPSGPVCAGTSVQFTATASSIGGGTVNYNFKVGGVSQQSSSSNTYTTSGLSNGNQVTCDITVSGGTCMAATTATSNTITMTVNANNTPTVSIVASPSGAICAGTSVQFTATASSIGGGTVNYNFKVGGVSQQSSSSNTYTTSGLSNGNQVTCDITVSGGNCMAATTATSNTITMTVNANNTPTVSIAASPSGPICAGTSVQFTATASSVGGGTVNYNFKVGGVSQQSSSSNTYTTSGLANGNQVTCDIAVTGGTCMASTTATSNTITMTVNANNTPTVSIVASPSGAICAGTSVQFTATASNIGGGTVNYNFKVGGVSQQSSSSNTYTTSSLSNGNQVTCDITVSGGTCMASTTATSNTITMTVNASNTPTVSIVPSPSGAICAGTSVQFTATAAGTSSGTVNYNFKVNGSSQQSSSSNTYTNSSLANGDQVTCDITVTGGTCMASTTATSNTITMTVNATAVVNAGGNQTICAGNTATLNGSIGGGASSATWSGGSGTFTPNAATLNATYNPSASEVLAGTVTLTLTTNDPAGPCGPAANSMTITIGTTSGVAASPGSGQVCRNMNVGTGATYTNASCNVIAGIVPNGASPVSGMVNTCVTVDATVQFYNSHAYVQRHFDINPASNASTATARITLYATQADFNNYNANNGGDLDLPTGPGDLLGIANLRVSKYSGTGTAPGTYIPGTFTYIDPADADIIWDASHGWWTITFNVSGFSGFFIAGFNPANAALPVTILNFSGYKNGNNNRLQWTTATENNNRGFELLRSTDGINYTALGFVNSQAVGGNSTIQLNYTYTDLNVAGSRWYYRLRQVDLDGHSKFSNIVLLTSSRPTILTIDGLFPNPATEVVNVLIGAPNKDKVTIIVTDISGRTVIKQLADVEAGSNTIPINVNNIVNGTYVVKLVCGSGECDKAIGKFVKQ